jgi:hypothetical protein
MITITAATGLKARVAAVEKEHFSSEWLSVGCILKVFLSLACALNCSRFLSP